MPRTLKTVVRGLQRRWRNRSKAPSRPSGDPASFGTLIDRRAAWLHAHFPEPVVRYQTDIFTKASQKALATRLGALTATTYTMDVSLDEAIEYVAEHRLERCVIKPVLSLNGIGCRLLVADGAHYRDLVSGQTAPLAVHRRQLRRAYAPLERADAWLVEELMLPFDGQMRRIDDVKFFCFGGRVELISHIRRVGRKKYRHRFTRDWEPVVTCAEDNLPETNAVPINGGRLVALAERLSSRLLYPFIRVDLYDTTRGIVLGEFTPGPGGRHRFNADWNERLVKRWHEAAETLLTGVRDGTVQMLGPTEP